MNLPGLNRKRDCRNKNLLVRKTKGEKKWRAHKDSVRFVINQYSQKDREQIMSCIYC